MTKPARYSVNKIAADMQPKDRFYLSGKKYVVTNETYKDLFERVVITFISVDGSPTAFCDLHVSEDFPFMVLTGESGIKENAYKELQRLRENDKAAEVTGERPMEVQAVNFEKKVLEIVLPTKNDAEVVMEHLFQFIVLHDVVSVGDLYEAVGVIGTYEDTKWGWSNLAGSGVKKTPQGYQLVLPKPVAIGTGRLPS
jgi:hypothetical protein